MGRSNIRQFMVGVLLASPILLSAPGPANGQDASEAELVQLAHDFMEALSSRDAGTLRELLAPQAMIYSVREGEDGPVYGVRTAADFLEGIGSGSSPILERIWNPIVEVKGRVAMVWAPYDFHSGDTFSHCGIDVLTYLKLEGGWKATSITYDVVREGCAPSPLGAPGGLEIRPGPLPPAEGRSALSAHSRDAHRPAYLHASGTLASVDSPSLPTEPLKCSLEKPSL